MSDDRIYLPNVGDIVTSIKEEPEWVEATENFKVTSEFKSPGVVKVIAEANVGWVCEVVVTHVPDSRSPYEYLVSLVTPRRTCYGLNTFEPHDDYIHEKFVGIHGINAGEFALLTMTIRRALLVTRMRNG